MDKLRRSTAAKIIIAFVLAVTTTITVIGGGLLIVLAIDHGLYDSKYEKYEDRLMETFVYNKEMQVWNSYVSWDESGKERKLIIDKDATEGNKSFDGIAFSIKDSKDKVIFDNHSRDVEYSKKYEADHWDGMNGNEEWYVMTAYVEKDAPEGSIPYRTEKIAKYTYDNRASLAAASVVLGILSILLFIFLMFGAGRRKEDDDIHLRWIDRGYADVYLAAAAAAIIGLFVLTFDASYESIPAGIILATVCGFIICLIAIAFFMSAAVQAKNHTLIKNMLLAKACRLALRFLKKIPAIWRVILPVGVILFFNMLLTSDSGQSGIVVIASIIVFFIAGYMGINYSKVLKGAEKIAEGEADHRIDTGKMIGSIKNHADNLNSINEAVSKAVDQQMKSERFKTELITNVSHDIKTPLTSIINYSQLLKTHADEIGADEVSMEYIDVIDQNALRLKKLAVDIVEASKASTGNIQVELRELDLGMLVSQALGEYEGRLEESGMTLISSIKEGLMINADGRHMWRVIDNILSNICKYAQGGTRVYVDVGRNGNKAEAVFKNVSKYELNITSEELMERFVRGDESRNTEGSGLGLSIASDLVEIQDGRLGIDIDGDLFKVTVSFDEIKKTDSEYVMNEC